MIKNKYQHVMQPTANGFPKAISDFLAKVGDGCVLATDYTEVDLDKLPSNQ